MSTQESDNHNPVFNFYYYWNNVCIIIVIMKTSTKQEQKLFCVQGLLSTLRLCSECLSNG